jgi:probable addiction module antidote protein
MTRKIRIQDLHEFNVSKYLKSNTEISLYLNEVLKDGDSRFINDALFDVAQSLGMSEIAKTAGVERRALYHALTSKDPASVALVKQVTLSFGAKLNANLAD